MNSDAIKQVIDSVYKYVWDWPEALPYFIVLLLGAGIFLTTRLRIIQVRKVSHALAIVAGYYDDPKDKGEISHFQALTSALSATIGIGNISGVATAIHYGGPGALFWMWVTAILGCASKYAECTLSNHYREVHEDETVSGGPMYYIEKGMGKNWKWLAIIFAACAVISSFGSGNAVQAFTVADSFRSDFGIPTWITGAVSASLVAMVIVGGIKRIGRVTSRLVPVMSILYFLGAITVLFLNAPRIPAAIMTIFNDAFTAKAGVGGFFGSTFMFMMVWGVKRGIFSNEAGQGSAPIAHAAAKTDEPVREGLVAMIGPYIDTLLICTLTGLVIVTVGVWHGKKIETIPFNKQSDISILVSSAEIGENGHFEDSAKMSGSFTVSRGEASGVSFVRNDSFVDDAVVLLGDEPFNGTVEVGEDGTPVFTDGFGQAVTGEEIQLAGAMMQNGSPLTAWAFKRGLDPIWSGGNYIVTIAVFMFAISTAISWSYYGDRSIEYLFGRSYIMPYRIVFCIVHFLATVLSLELVWGFGDTALGMMAIPNLIALFALSGVVKKLTTDYFSREHKRYKKKLFGG
jgi:AGCS family alanine or glycine:cation symporter